MVWVTVHHLVTLRDNGPGAAEPEGKQRVLMLLGVPRDHVCKEHPRAPALPLDLPGCSRHPRRTAAPQEDPGARHLTSDFCVRLEKRLGFPGFFKFYFLF